jgi:dTDP-glucose 4,6-dehydratase
VDKLKVLITGSCGFIFGNFIRKAIYEKQPYSFVSIDRINNNTINSMYWNKNHTFHIADIRDQHVIDIIFQFEKPDIVIHGAGETHVDNSLSDPNSFVTSNVLGTQVLINASIKYGVKKFIYISSDEVYGQLTSEDEPSWTEESPLNPRNPYSATKTSGELLVKAANQCHGLIYNITRTVNNYGPRQLSDKFIPKVIKLITQKKPIPIYGNGLQVRDWIHVFDNCNGIMTVLNNGKPNEIYNISANQEYTNLEVVQKICNTMKTGHDLISFVENPRKTGEDFRYSANSDKLQKLGWKPTIKFKDGIEQCTFWFNNNLWWFK